MKHDAHQAPPPAPDGADIVHFLHAREKRRGAAETGWSGQIAALALQLEARGNSRGGAVPLDGRWQRATAQLRLLPQRRIWRRRLPQPANDRAPFWHGGFARQQRRATENRTRASTTAGGSFAFTFLAVMMVVAATAIATDAATLYAVLPGF